MFNLDQFKNDIDNSIIDFCARYDIDSMKQEPQTVWNALLMYLYEHVVKHIDLKSHENITLENNNIASNCNMYNFDVLKDICDYYIYLCGLYDKEISIIGYSRLLNIDDSIIYNWLTVNKESNRLNAAGAHIAQKILKLREESLSNMLVSQGRRNPVGVLGVLNHHYAWSAQQIQQEQKARALTAAELPKLASAETLEVVKVIDKTSE